MASRDRAVQDRGRYCAYVPMKYAQCDQHPRKDGFVLLRDKDGWSPIAGHRPPG